MKGEKVDKASGFRKWHALDGTCMPNIVRIINLIQVKN